MFIEERHRAILDWLKEKGRISTSDIQDRFGVSYDSAKRDLRILEEKGLLKRTHGGALPLKKADSGGECHDLSSQERAESIKENYLSIARKAAAMIEPDDVVFLTSASIGFLVAKSLSPDLSCTVVVNSISIAEVLRSYEKVTVLVAGGEMHKNGCFYDGFALEMIGRLKFDKAFITSASISAGFGLSIQRSRNLELINAVIRRSQSIVGLFPSEKVGFDSVMSICPADRLTYLITDWETSEEDLKGFDQLGISIVVTEPE